MPLKSIILPIDFPSQNTEVSELFISDPETNNTHPPLLLVLIVALSLLPLALSITLTFTFPSYILFL